MSIHDKSNWQLLEDQYNYQVALNNQGYAQQEKMFGMYNDRQDTLMRIAPSVNKAALKSAGYSTISGSSGSGSSGPSVVSSAPVSGGSAPNVGAAISARQQTINSIISTAMSLFQDIPEMMLQRRQSAKLQSETKYQDIINQGAAAEQIARINKLRSDKVLTDRQADIALENLGIIRDTRDYTVQSAYQDLVSKQLGNQIQQNNVDMLDYQNEITKLSADIKRGERERINQEIDAFEKHLSAELTEIYSRVNLNDAKSVESASSTALNAVKKIGEEYTNKIKLIDSKFAYATNEMTQEQLDANTRLIEQKIKLAASQTEYSDDKNKREWFQLIPNIISNGVSDFVKLMKIK